MMNTSYSFNTIVPNNKKKNTLRSVLTAEQHQTQSNAHIQNLLNHKINIINAQLKHLKIINNALSYDGRD